MANAITLKWVRPELVDYPKVWHTFKAKDIGSDDLVGYRIQDLPESRNDEALTMIVDIFCRDEPLCDAYGVLNYPEAVGDFLMLWKIMIKQKMALVCFKEGSDEIIGLNMNFVESKDEQFMEKCYQQFKSDVSKRIFEAILLLYEDYDPFKELNIDCYMSSVGLVVASKYRGRNIGQEFLGIRRTVCEHFGIKYTSTMFSSDFSNRNADQAGFKLNRILSYDEAREKHPELKIPPMKSKFFTIKSIAF